MSQFITNQYIFDGLTTENEVIIRYMPVYFPLDVVFEVGWTFPFFS